MFPRVPFRSGENHQFDMPCPDQEQAAMFPRVPFRSGENHQFDMPCPDQEQGPDYIPYDHPRIMDVQNEPPPSAHNMAGEVWYRGVISGVKKSFGFIERADIAQEIFFHYNEFCGNPETLVVGENVEFTIAEVKGREVAVGVRLLPMGTVILHDISVRWFEGTVIRIKSLPGCIRATINCTKELSFTVNDIRTKATLLEGDHVQFNVSIDRRNKLERATNIEILPDTFQHTNEIRETGLVVAMNNDFGFIKCWDRNISKMFFPYSEILGEVQLKLSDIVEFTEIPDKFSENCFAGRIKKLSTHPSEILSMERFVGVVKEEAVVTPLEAHIKGKEKDVVSGFITYEEQGMTLTVPYYKNDLEGSACPRTGDKVEFNICKMLKTDQRKAVQVTICQWNDNARLHGNASQDQEMFHYSEENREDYNRGPSSQVAYPSNEQGDIGYPWGGGHCTSWHEDESGGSSRERDEETMQHRGNLWPEMRGCSSERPPEQTERSRSCSHTPPSRQFNSNASMGLRELELARKRKQKAELELEIAQREMALTAEYGISRQAVQLTEAPNRGQLPHNVDAPKESTARGKLEEDYSGISSSQGRNPLNHRRDIDWGSPHRQCQQEEGSSGRNLEMDRETMHPTVNQEPQSRAYSSESFRQHKPNRSRSRSPPSRHFNRTGEEYRELELAHKIKMLEELEWERAGTTRYDISGLPSRATEDVKCGPVRTDEGPPMPKKSILKKQGEPVMDPAIGIESSDDSRQPPVSTQTKRFLSALNRCLGSGLFSSRLREAREETQRQISDGSVHCEHRSKDSTEAENPEESICEFLLPHERISQDDTGFSRILGIMGDDNPIQREKQWHSPDIEDEEKFLYGEDKEEKSVGQASHQPQSKVVAQPEIGHCSVGRSGIAHHRMSQPAVGTQQRTTGIGGQRSKIAPSRHQEIQPGNLNRPQESKSGTGPPQKRQPDSVGSQQRQPVVDHNPPKPSEKDQDAPIVDEPPDSQEFERIQNLLKTIGLDIGEAEFSKMAARTQERLYGKKPAAGSSRRSERERELRGVARRSWETHHSPTKSPVSDYNRSISPSPTRRPSHEYSSKEEGKKLKPIQRLGENKHPPTPHSEFQLQQAGYDQYGNNMGTSPSQEPHSSTSIHQSNLRVIETVSLNESRVQQKSSNSMNLKVFGEAERLTQEEEARLKKKENIIMELERLQKLQAASGSLAQQHSHTDSPDPSPGSWTPHGEYSSSLVSVHANKTEGKEWWEKPGPPVLSSAPVGIPSPTVFITPTPPAPQPINFVPPPQHVNFLPPSHSAPQHVAFMPHTVPQHLPFPPHAGACSLPAYSQYPPPPGHGQYGNYTPANPMPQGWPMYPPQSQGPYPGPHHGRPSFFKQKRFNPMAMRNLSVLKAVAVNTNEAETKEKN
ncbi:hypothetical protein AOXY_G7949 [Acipenser oxyrinchus oxyrinchus]|uniref:CSD domain-containing protein n=1 Tax=Acipenser oxyrinchus oxyrinchus TaxID=40147 RepID=A0AAD8GAX0_ACIOX|nr:hypothetical protein AOXY_G7949 [Acipenser oxyrinchus oxyrinchus]